MKGSSSVEKLIRCTHRNWKGQLNKNAEWDAKLGLALF